MIRAVARALAIFDVFAEQNLSLTLREIGQRIAMPKATTFRLVNTLERADFLIRLDNHQTMLVSKIDTWRWRIIIVPTTIALILLVVLSRVYLGMHYLHRSPRSMLCAQPEFKQSQPVQCIVNSSAPRFSLA